MPSDRVSCPRPRRAPAPSGRGPARAARRRTDAAAPPTGAAGKSYRPNPRDALDLTRAALPSPLKIQTHPDRHQKLLSPHRISLAEPRCRTAIWRISAFQTKDTMTPVSLHRIQQSYVVLTPLI